MRSNGITTKKGSSKSHILKKVNNNHSNNRSNNVAIKKLK